MATIRERIDEFIYPVLERFTAMVYEGGEDTVFQGVRVLDDDIKFTHGALVNAAATLYVHYVKRSDKRAAEVLERLHYFIEIAASNVCKTWGKIAILRGFILLNKNNLLSDIQPDYIELVKERTNYEDFFDKEKMDTRGMATNYLQVAMACAGMRERLGWENDGYSEKIKQKLATVMLDKSVNGWMDDEIPYGRFDRYSIVLAAEFADTARSACLEVPGFVRDNLRLAAESMLFLANNKGDGFLYGRSIAIHGDNTPAEVISTAFAEGLIRAEERDTALIYIMRILDKLFSYWYDEERGCFNMWWDGRGYDTYRPVDRILETNLDIINHIYMVLCNLEEAGVADIEVEGVLPEPCEWQIYELDFIKRPDEVRKAIFMKRADKLVMLPFVGFGKGWGVHSSYFPFPAIAGGRLEAAQQADYPFFIPQYTDGDGNKHLPAQYFDTVNTVHDGDTVTVRAEGFLGKRIGKAAEITDIRFTIDYKFEGEKITVSTTTSKPMASAEMITAASGVEVCAIGFDSCEDVETEGKIEFCAVHSKLAYVKLYKAQTPGVLGYTIYLH